MEKEIRLVLKKIKIQYCLIKETEAYLDSLCISSELRSNPIHCQVTIVNISLKLLKECQKSNKIQAEKEVSIRIPC